MTMDAFREQVRPDALQRTQSSLVLEAIAKAENIEATDADVDAKLEEMSKQYGMELDQLKTLVGDNEKESMKKDIAIEKAIALIMDNVKETAKKKATKKADEEESAEEKPAKKTTKKATKKADEE
jgi:trigger factor